MCCKYNGQWYIEPQTLKNTIELVRYLKDKYNITNIARHYDCTKKICPEPLVRNENLWQDFLKEVNMELTTQEKVKEIERIANLDDNTGLYLQFYRYSIPLIDKLYKICQDAENWRKNNAWELPTNEF